MATISEQRVMVFCDSNEPPDDVIAHGVRLATIFRKELCLFHPLTTTDKKERNDVQDKLGKVIRDLKSQRVDLPLSILTLPGRLNDLVEKLADDYDGILLILTPENIKEKLAALRESAIPFLFTHGNSAQYLRYNRIVLTLDDKKSARDVALWGTYFGRFNQASIEMRVLRGKDEDERSAITKNLQSIRELLSGLKIKVRFIQMPGNDLSYEGTAKTFNFMIMANRHIQTTDDLFRFPEAELISQAEEMPVLCVNANRAMYILCD